VSGNPNLRADCAKLVQLRHFGQPRTPHPHPQPQVLHEFSSNPKGIFALAISTAHKPKENKPLLPRIWGEGGVAEPAPRGAS
jgi:hypothetical protein